MNYRLVPLTRGKVALVDIEDYERVSRFKWYANYHRNRGEGGVFYAARTIRATGGHKKRTVLLHRFILNAPAGMDVDHIDRSRSLDCRRSNLRLASHTQNNANQRKTRTPTSSRYKGVYKIHRLGKWKAEVQVCGKYTNLGMFVNEEDAARAYNAAAVRHFGEFALLNVVPAVLP